MKIKELECAFIWLMIQVIRLFSWIIWWIRLSRSLERDKVSLILFFKMKRKGGMFAMLYLSVVTRIRNLNPPPTREKGNFFYLERPPFFLFRLPTPPDDFLLLERRRDGGVELRIDVAFSSSSSKIKWKGSWLVKCHCPVSCNISRGRTSAAADPCYF